MDTTGRDVVEVDFEDIGIVTGTITEGAAAKFKIISDKDNPNKGTLEILPSVETLDIFSQLNKLVNFHPKSGTSQSGELFVFKPARVERDGDGWKITEKFFVGGVSKVRQQAATVTEEVTPKGLTNQESPLNDLNDIESQIKEALVMVRLLQRKEHF